MTHLELELRDLGAHLEIPPAPPLTGAVRTRLTHRRHRLLVLALATVVAALAVALAVPGSRASLLRFLHLRGAAVTLVDRLPRVTPRRSLGTPIPLGQAPFRLLLPNGRRPERVYAGDGHEELVRGAVFNELDTRALRTGVIAAGNDPLVSNRPGGIPTTVIGPSLLFDELEVKRADTSKDKLPEYPPPPLAKK